MPLFEAYLEATVVMHCFNGSAVVYLPPNVEIDLRKVCAESGYIFTIGRALYVRNLEKASRTELEDILQKASPNETLRHLVAFSTEQFSPHDKDTQEDFRDTLNELKLSIDKVYLGNERLTDVLTALSNAKDNRVWVGAPGPYRQERADFKKKAKAEFPRTTIMFSDTDVDFAVPRFRRRRFLICYEQYFKNENPYHIFDENKLAWVSHTTIPHTLIGAMINVTRPGWERIDPTIVDPFVGTGTTWLELLKFQEVICVCSDRSVYTKRLADDNIAFFSLSQDDLAILAERLQNLSDEIGITAVDFKGISGDLHRLRPKVAELVAVYPNSGVPDSSGQELFDLLEKQTSLYNRLMIYLLLRTYGRHGAELNRNELTVAVAFKKELDKFRRQLREYKELRDDAESEVASLSDDVWAGYPSLYSCGLTIKPSFLSAYNTDDSRCGVACCRDALDIRNNIDVIIGDPPYGFNTDEEESRLSNFYVKFVRKAVRSLSPDHGQLILALPEQSYTGRRAQYFTHREVVTALVLSEAERCGKEVYIPSAITPIRSLFKPPYYWEAGRALRRAVVHYHIRAKRSGHGRSTR